MNISDICHSNDKQAYTHASSNISNPPSTSKAIPYLYHENDYEVA